MRVIKNLFSRKDNSAIHSVVPVKGRNISKTIHLENPSSEIQLRAVTNRLDRDVRTRHLAFKKVWPFGERQVLGMVQYDTVFIHPGGASEPKRAQTFVDLESLCYLIGIFEKYGWDEIDELASEVVQEWNEKYSQPKAGLGSDRKSVERVITIAEKTLLGQTGKPERSQFRVVVTSYAFAYAANATPDDEVFITKEDLKFQVTVWGEGVNRAKESWAAANAARYGNKRFAPYHQNKPNSVAGGASGSDKPGGVSAGDLKVIAEEKGNYLPGQPQIVYRDFKTLVESRETYKFLYECLAYHPDEVDVKQFKYDPIQGLRVYLMGWEPGRTNTAAEIRQLTDHFEAFEAGHLQEDPRMLPCLAVRERE